MVDETAPAPAEPKRWLRRKLASRRASDHEEAGRFLESQGSAGVEMLVELVHAEARNRRRRRRFLDLVWGSYVTVAVLILVTWVVMGVATKDWSGFPKAVLRLLTLGGVVGSATFVTRFQKQGTEWLARFDDPRVIGPLLEALDSGDDDLEEVAGPALASALLRLTAEHRGILSPHQRQILRNQVDDAGPELLPGLLHALRVLEDTAAISEVEALVGRLERSETSEPALIESARSALSELQALKALEEQRQTLLRPAAGASEDRLLRPAASSHESGEEILLRPSASGP